jgi:3-oxoacyl-[acyl-carrier-protein] synthase-1
MSPAPKPFVIDLGIVTALGSGKKTNLDGLLSGPPPELSHETIGGKSFRIARVPESRRPMDGYPADCRNRVNALLVEAGGQIASSIEAAAALYGKGRIAVILGSTDNGSEESLAAVSHRRDSGTFPEGYSLYRQSAELAPDFLASILGVCGPVMAVSTACASAATALARARELIAANLCDAAVAGGADIVSDSVALGFDSLEAVSGERCLPFSRNRRGITLGEGAALFLIARDDLAATAPGAVAAPGESIRLLGFGEASDAHHLTAPDPEGRGAAAAMRAALGDSGLEPSGIGYLNLHGTGTALNDAMESRAVAAVFGPKGVPASSTKGYVGHTLGAAGAVELGFCCLALSGLNESRLLPPHAWDGEADEDLPPLDLAGPGRRAESISACMSVSFAFGGVDVAVVIGKEAKR